MYFDDSPYKSIGTKKIMVSASDLILRIVAWGSVFSTCM